MDVTSKSTSSAHWQPDCGNDNDNVIPQPVSQRANLETPEPRAVGRTTASESVSLFDRVICFIADTVGLGATYRSYKMLEALEGLSAGIGESAKASREEYEKINEHKSEFSGLFSEFAEIAKPEELKSFNDVLKKSLESYSDAQLKKALVYLHSDKICKSVRELTLDVVATRIGTPMLETIRGGFSEGNPSLDPFHFLAMSEAERKFSLAVAGLGEGLIEYIESKVIEIFKEAILEWSENSQALVKKIRAQIELGKPLVESDGPANNRWTRASKILIAANDKALIAQKQFCSRVSSANPAAD